MFRESPSLAQIGGDLSMCTQIFLGTTATIPQKQDPLQPGQSQHHSAARTNGAPEMLKSELSEPIRARVWGCPWLKGRDVCSVAGALAGRGGAFQSRIHSGGAIDLDSFSPRGEGRGGGCCG